jgi:lipoprotein-anchoring transpeptidase ErfK/SrfK
MVRQIPLIRLPRTPFGLFVFGTAMASALVVLMIITLLSVAVLLVVSGRILPGVSSGGVSLRGLSVQEAAVRLNSAWNEIAVRDGDRTWTVNAADLGLTLDALATAQSAQQVGRGSGSVISALIGRVQVAPVLSVDPQQAADGVRAFAPGVEMPAENATIRMVNGTLRPVDAVTGRVLDVDATVSRFLADPGRELADGALDLVMNAVQPTVTDALPLLEKARTLLASPLTVNAFDPINNESVTWTVSDWGAWLTTKNTPNGVAFSVSEPELSEYLQTRVGELSEGRTIQVEDAVADIQGAVADMNPTANIRIFHKARTYTVQQGDTFLSIGWENGIPYWKVQEANPGVSTLSVGQQITIPSPDVMIPHEVVPNKRIVVSITQQRMWVYENGQLKWEWRASTGIVDSPTMPGVYQILSHDGTAYASNWNLYMPYFMSIYEAVPGFHNGIHGLPTRNGYGIIWENSVGTPITYGCILLNQQNADALYSWAEDGVIIEIQA